MIYRQLFDQESSTYTYLLADAASAKAVIIDPVLEHFERYTQLLAELNLTLLYAIDTHVHADHITALGKLRQHYGCDTVHGEQSQASGVSRHVADGDELRFGELCLRCIYTPGHTEESYCFLLADQRYLFTGDTLLIGATGRTDFQNGCAEQQYHSLFSKLFTLPDETRVLPGHDYRGNTESTLGQERKHNPRLQVASAAEYAQLMSQVQLPHPKQIDIAVPANLRVGL